MRQLAEARLEPWQLCWMEQHRLACVIERGDDLRYRDVVRALRGADDETRRTYRSLRRAGLSAEDALRGVGR